MPNDITNHRWLLLCVFNASTAAELEQALVDIKCDQFEREPWTLDSAKANQLRLAYRKKERELGTADGR